MEKQSNPARRKAKQKQTSVRISWPQLVKGEQQEQLTKHLLLLIPGKWCMVKGEQQEQE